MFPTQIAPGNQHMPLLLDAPVVLGDRFSRWLAPHAGGCIVALFAEPNQAGPPAWRRWPVLRNSSPRLMNSPSALIIGLEESLKNH